jgi:capsular polysaccharide biosynthesis protein
VHEIQLNGKRQAVPIGTKPNLGTFTEASQDEYGLSVTGLLRVIWRRLWIIVLVGIMFTALVVRFDFLQTPTYEATIKVLVGQEQESNGPTNLGSDVQGLQQLTKTVAEVVPTQTVADAVIQRLDLQTTPEDLLKNLSVQQASTTQVMDVSYRDPDPETAQEIANTIGAVLSDQVSEVSPNTNAITATVWEQAKVPDSPVSPNPLRDGLLALLLGGMLGVGLAILLEHLDDRWHSPEEVEQVSGVPTFGFIRQFKASNSQKERD